MRTPTLPVLRRATLVALAVALAGCDSAPDAFGPTADDLRPSFIIYNRQAAPMVHTLVHPYSGLSGPGCSSQVDDNLGGGAFDFSVAKNGGQEFRMDPGCYVFFVRWQGQPGHVQVAASLGVDGNGYATLFNAPTPTPAAAIDGTLTINNTAAGHTASITRIYTDACGSNLLYGRGPSGGATTMQNVNVAHGASITLNLPSTCHILSLMFSNGRYDIGVVTIPSTTKTLTVKTTPY